tara:strand:- start:306536 stop:307861 length:1326 start_codon:yes stop_codon:yes gene_type:complete
MAAAAATGQSCETQEVARLDPSEVSSLSQYGGSVALWGDVGVVGAEGDAALGDFAGSAFLFDAQTGTQLHKLLAHDGQHLRGFGTSVALNSTHAIIGCRINPTNGSARGVYLFDIDTGEQAHKLLPDEHFTDNGFGSRVAANDQYILASAIYDDDRGEFAGAVYVFDAHTFDQLWKLKLPDGVRQDLFGSVIDIHGDKAVITTRVLNFDNRAREGLVYIFDLVTGQQIARFAPQHPRTSTYFGSSAAINDSVVAIGSSGLRHDEGGSGAVYMYDIATEEQVGFLRPTDGERFTGFGASVDMSNDRIVVGARGVSGLHFGAAYQYDGSSHEQMSKLLPSDLETSIDYFGLAVSIFEDRMLVGSEANDDDGAYTGAAYLFETVCDPLPCQADLTGDGVLDFFDISGFLVQFENNGQIADFDGDGVWDFFDISAFIDAFAAGCP